MPCHVARCHDVTAQDYKTGLADIYVGVPTKEFLALFDGFEPVSEAAVPKVVDSLLVADANAFTEHFEFRHNLKR